jgi:hypothetical protein
MTKQIICLENRGHRPLPRRQRNEIFVIPCKIAGCWRLKPGDQFKQRRLADAGRPLNRENLATRNAEIIGEMEILTPAEPKSLNP